MRTKLLITILNILAISLSASAQSTATVKSFIQTADHIPGGDRRNDLNGEPCALVKVQVVDDIERVEGNRIGDIVNKGVEKWVYMCKGSRNMRLHLKNHLPVRIMFQDYQINGLESNRVYELVIQSPDSNADGRDIMQTFILNYSPANATVLIDSKLYRGNGRIEASLPVGDHNYTIAADGYITSEGTVRLSQYAKREITETLIAENQNAHANPYNNDAVEELPDQDNYEAQEYDQTILNEGSSRSQKTYTKDMINGVGAFFYDGLYYIVISQDRKTVAVVKPKKVKYEARAYTVPSKVSRGEEIFTVTEIAPGAFLKSKKLQEIKLPETIEAIGEAAFAFCGKLSHIDFPRNLRYIGSSAFVFDNITELILPNSIEELADNAFLLCKKRTMIGHTQMGKLYVPSSIKVIGKHAFAGLVNGFGRYWTAKFDIENLPDWVTPEIAKEIGIHEDSYEQYIKKRSKRR